LPAAPVVLNILVDHRSPELVIAGPRSSTEVAKRLLVVLDHPEISRIEAGNSNPTLSTIAALGYALEAELSLEVRQAAKSEGKRRTPAVAASTRRHATLATAAGKVSAPFVGRAKAQAR
jgi:hypothetical protein